MAEISGEEVKLQRQETRMLEELLDYARKEYAGLEFETRIFDLTEQFRRTRRKGKYRAPKSFGKIGRGNMVAGFIVYGKEGMPPLIDKYGPGLNLNSFSKAAEFLSIAYIPGTLENTTLQEVLGPTEEQFRVQGFSRTVLERIGTYATQQTEKFSFERDSLFMVAGPNGRAVARAKLIRHWYEQATRYGRDAMEKMSSEEAAMMEIAIGAEKLAELKETNYLNFPMYTKWQPSPVSRAFIYHKIQAHERMIKS
jgi:hypothetical protein